MRCASARSAGGMAAVAAFSMAGPSPLAALRSFMRSFMAAFSPAERLAFFGVEGVFAGMVLTSVCVRAGRPATPRCRWRRTAAARAWRRAGRRPACRSWSTAPSCATARSRPPGRRRPSSSFLAWVSWAGSLPPLVRRSVLLLDDEERAADGARELGLLARELEGRQLGRDLHPLAELEAHRALAAGRQRVQHVDGEAVLVEHLGPADAVDLEVGGLQGGRSEERRVGKECRSRGSP